MSKHRFLLLWIVVTLAATSGASCPQVLQQYTQPIPRALPPAATLKQVIDVVNDNSAKIQSFSSQRASISSPGLPGSLRANIAYQKPLYFRLRAETTFLGPELDAGSNDQLFWVWIRRSQPPALYFCRHDQFYSSPIRQILPVDPSWLSEAFGVVTFDPAVPHQGPVPVGSGRLKVQSTLPPDGLVRSVVVDDSRGVVLEVDLYDRGGSRLLASAALSRHMRDAGSGAILPRHIKVDWQQPKTEIEIDLADLQINHPEANPPDLWVKPVRAGWPDVDLSRPNLPIASPQTVAPPMASLPYAGPGTVIR